MRNPFWKENILAFLIHKLPDWLDVNCPFFIAKTEYGNYIANSWKGANLLLDEGDGPDPNGIITIEWMRRSIANALPDA